MSGYFGISDIAQDVVIGGGRTLSPPSSARRRATKPKGLFSTTFRLSSPNRPTSRSRLWALGRFWHFAGSDLVYDGLQIRDGPLSLALSPSEGERVPRAREGAVQGRKARVPSGNSHPNPWGNIAHNSMSQAGESQRDSGPKPRVASSELPGEKAPERGQPQRGCAGWRGNGGHNPVGVGTFRRSSPRVARCSQPWAEGHNPFGIGRGSRGLVGNAQPWGEGTTFGRQRLCWGLATRPPRVGAGMRIAGRARGQSWGLSTTPSSQVWAAGSR